MTNLQTMPSTIRDRLQALVGAELRDAGRAVGLVWLLFVPKHHASHPTMTSFEDELHLHIQCAWRITQAETILVASSDRFYPKGDPDQEDANFDWTVPGSNRCDERLAQVIAGRDEIPWRVSSVRADPFGGFEVRFGRRRRLSVFPDDSLQAEYWRIFDKDPSHTHFVVTGHGVIQE